MSEEYRRLWLCRKTLTEMLTDRGYQVAQLPTKEEFVARYPSLLTRSTLNFAASKEQRTIMVHFCDELKLGIKQIKSILETYERQGVFNIILVCREAPSSASQKVLNELSTNFTVEIFKEDELLFNITTHELVPKHTILGNEEKENMMRSMRVKEYQLPKILKSDPVARYFGAKVGDVFKIERRSNSGVKSLYYRIVIDK
ncbi:DNA-directed RNA polymerases II and IV subunit 5A [Astathelohania contejeani]|uniref:DNA-directed RNA polymerases I, II, and III subunit RPABC1 n=1 Tax=Astathelohania contejeani TaxID=164912 RepID=A0ABQ7HZ58_9MICR|nr:DNA-directed RNA polymerases II and IV subunit 5A [Thelohania contejeani]